MACTEVSNSSGGSSNSSSSRCCRRSCRIGWTVQLLPIVWLLCIAQANAQQKFYNFTEEDWNRQFTKGKWDYLGKVGVERARNAIIIGVFAHEKTRILDVGSGEGALTDFIKTEEQKKGYVGLDISKEAVRIAKSKRSQFTFLQGTAESFKPPDHKPYDLIIFNEVLYYFDHIQLLKQYSSSKYLAKDGIIVISVWFTNKIDFLRKGIFGDARKLLEPIDAMDLSGETGPGKKKSPISFHIEGFRVR
jgi:SAM-dependent methyltransferase